MGLFLLRCCRIFKFISFPVNIIAIIIMAHHMICQLDILIELFM